MVNAVSVSGTTATVTGSETYSSTTRSIANIRTLGASFIGVRDGVEDVLDNNERIIINGTIVDETGQFNLRLTNNSSLKIQANTNGVFRVGKVDTSGALPVYSKGGTLTIVPGAVGSASGEYIHFSDHQSDTTGTLEFYDTLINFYGKSNGGRVDFYATGYGGCTIHGIAQGSQSKNSMTMRLKTAVNFNDNILSGIPAVEFDGTVASFARNKFIDLTNGFVAFSNGAIVTLDAPDFLGTLPSRWGWISNAGFIFNDTKINSIPATEAQIQSVQAILDRRGHGGSDVATADRVFRFNKTHKETIVDASGNAVSDVKVWFRDNTSKIYTPSVNAQGKYSQVIDLKKSNNGSSNYEAVTMSFDNYYPIDKIIYRHGSNIQTSSYQNYNDFPSIGIDAESKVFLTDNALVTELDKSVIGAWTDVGTATRIYNAFSVWKESNLPSPTLGTLPVTRSGNTIDAGAYNVTIANAGANPVAYASNNITIKTAQLTDNITTTGTITIPNSGFTLRGFLTDNTKHTFSIDNIPTSSHLRVVKSVGGSDTTLIDEASTTNATEYFFVEKTAAIKILIESTTRTMTNERTLTAQEITNNPQINANNLLAPAIPATLRNDIAVSISSNVLNVVKTSGAPQITTDQFEVLLMNLITQNNTLDGKASLYSRQGNIFTLVPPLNTGSDFNGDFGVILPAGQNLLQLGNVIVTSLKRADGKVKVNINVPANSWWMLVKDSDGSVLQAPTQASTSLQLDENMDVKLTVKTKDKQDFQQIYNTGQGVTITPSPLPHNSYNPLAVLSSAEKGYWNVSFTSNKLLIYVNSSSKVASSLNDPSTAKNLLDHVITSADGVQFINAHGVGKYGFTGNSITIDHTIIEFHKSSSLAASAVVSTSFYVTRLDNTTYTSPNGDVYISDKALNLSVDQPTLEGYADYAANKNASTLLASDEWQVHASKTPHTVLVDTSFHSFARATLQGVNDTADEINGKLPVTVVIDNSLRSHVSAGFDNVSTADEIASQFYGRSEWQILDSKLPQTVLVDTSLRSHVDARFDAMPSASGDSDATMIIDAVVAVERSIASVMQAQLEQVESLAIEARDYGQIAANNSQ